MHGEEKGPRQSQRLARSVLPQMSVADAPKTSGESMLAFMPPVKYTVPQSSRGWKGRPEEGEDPDSWYDMLGKRNGPPTNYWRQRMDERVHTNCNDAMRAALGDGAADVSDFVEEGLLALEMRMGIAKPRSNRKLLGTWAPIIINGRRVGTPETDAKDGGIAVPLSVTIERAGERKTFEHRYGTFDSHMELGEALEVVVEVAERGTQSGELVASAENTRVELPLELPGDSRLCVGGITLLNDYMLVARDGGALKDVFIRTSPPSVAEPQMKMP